MIERERERFVYCIYILHGALRSFSQFAATALSPSWLATFRKHEGLASHV